MELPEIFPLCLWFAYNISNDELLNFIRSIKPNKKYVNQNLYSIKFPLIIAALTDNQLISINIIMFLAMCDSEIWNNIFYVLIILGNIFDFDYEKMIGIFLNNISSQILCGEIEKTPEVIEKVLKISKNFILFRDNHIKIEFYQKMFENSPFKTNVNIIKNIKSNEIIKNLKNLLKFNVYFKFGIRIDEKFNWKDKALAQNMINLILMNNDVKHLEFYLILCYFVQKTSPNFTILHLKSLYLKTNNKKEIQSLIDLLCFQTEKMKLNNPLRNLRSNNYVNNSALALEIVEKWTPVFDRNVISEIKAFQKKIFELLEQIE